MKQIFLAGLFFACASSAEAHDLHVHDMIDIIPAAQEAQIETALAKALSSRNQQIDVVTVRFKSDVDQFGEYFDHIDPISNLLEPKTKPGGSRNDNVTLLVFPGDTRILIAIGNGFPDAYKQVGDTIVGQQIIPKFVEGDIPGGIIAGVDAILAKLRLDVVPN